MSPQNYKSFRVRSPIRSFRDLEVYQKTIELSGEMLNLEFPKAYAEKLQKNKERLIELSRWVPKYIAESYGDKFTSIALSGKKLEKAQTIIADIIAELDILRSALAQENVKETLDKLLMSYQNQKRKILNLQRAWKRVFTK